MRNVSLLRTFFRYFFLKQFRKAHQINANSHAASLIQYKGGNSRQIPFPRPHPDALKGKAQRIHSCQITSAILLQK